jgi:hypothetical protein
VKNMRKKLFGLAAILSVIFIIFFYQINGTKAQNQSQIDIETDPTVQLFNVTNMKPGDWATKTLLVQNRGNLDFDYIMSSKFTSGSELLFNHLLLSVTDDKGFILYHGKLSDLKSIDRRYLKSFSEEKLYFKIEFPIELGNEFQGLHTEVSFDFNAQESTESDFDFNKITGGGTIEQNSKENSGKSFGFNVIPKKEGLSVNLQYTDHDSQTLKDIHVNDYAYNVKEIFDNKSVVGIEFDVIGDSDKGLVKLHVKMADYGEPGKNDKFFLEIIDGLNKGYKSGNENITGGNIQIH